MVTVYWSVFGSVPDRSNILHPVGGSVELPPILLVSPSASSVLIVLWSIRIGSPTLVGKYASLNTVSRRETTRCLQYAAHRRYSRKTAGSSQ